MLQFANRALNRLEDWLMVISMALITILITTQVVLRYVFASSFPWAEEVTRFIVIWMSFIGAAMGVRTGAHVSVDLLVTFVPPGWHRPLAATTAVCGLAFAIALVVYGYPIVALTARTGQVSSALQLPMAWVYSIFLIGGVLLAIRFAQLFANAVFGRGPFRDSEDQTSAPRLPGA